MSKLFFGLRTYPSIKGFLHRVEILRVGRLSVRLHSIDSADETPFLHSHPYSYLSVVIRGGYTERTVLPTGRLVARSWSFGSLIFRGASVYHRIDAVRPGTKTLFFAWEKSSGKSRKQEWALRRHPQVQVPPQYRDAPSGVYFSMLSGQPEYRRREGGVWYAARRDYMRALYTPVVSIRQNILVPGLNMGTSACSLKSETRTETKH